MKDSLFIKICLFMIIILLGVNLFLKQIYSDRYIIRTVQGNNSHPGYVIKFDKKTGEMWSIDVSGIGSAEAWQIGWIEKRFK